MIKTGDRQHEFGYYTAARNAGDHYGDRPPVIGLRPYHAIVAAYRERARAKRERTAREVAALAHARAVVGAVIEGGGVGAITRGDFERAVLRATPSNRLDLLDPAMLTRALDEAVKRGALLRGYGEGFHRPSKAAERIVAMGGPPLW